MITQAEQRCSLNDYQAKFLAYDMTAKPFAKTVHRLSHALMEAKIDFNPHQIEAALFALRSPLSKGVILADEVGLGKTIEAGLVMAQYWAENKRRLIVVCPASLRKQWALELEEKFDLPSRILESKTYQELLQAGDNPLDFEGVIIMSYPFAARLKEELQRIEWNLCVLDEAHKLRNMHKPDNKTAYSLFEAFYGRKKLLLTATPLQNSLMELFSLSVFIDDKHFGDEGAFIESYINGKRDVEELKRRIKPFIHRTLRKDVLEYIQYTNREAMTLPFSPSEKEQALYDKVSEFALNSGSNGRYVMFNNLMALTFRKLMASSTAAILGTLQKTKAHIQHHQHSLEDATLLKSILKDHEMEEDYEERLARIPYGNVPDKNRQQTIQRQEMTVTALDEMIALAQDIETDAKTEKLLHAL